MKPIPILVLAYDNGWLTAHTLYCLGQSKYFDIHLLSRLPDNPFRLLPRVRSNHFLPREESNDVFMTFARQVVEKTGARVLVPISDRGFRWAVANREAIEQFIPVIPIPEPWAYDIALDKGQLAAFMQTHHIPAPLTLHDLTHNLAAQLEDFPFPALLKPKRGGGGQGEEVGEPPITYFTDRNALLSFMNKHPVIASRYIVQAFVKGYVIGCNVLYKNGRLIAYTIQKSVIPHEAFGPSWALEFIDNQEVIEMVDALLSKLNWSGVSNIDLIYDTSNNTVQILEINPRFWQTIAGSMTRARVNFPSLACLLTLQGSVEQRPYHLGRYIPLGPYFKYQRAAVTKEKFRFREVDLRMFFTTLPCRVYEMYKKKKQK